MKRFFFSGFLLLLSFFFILSGHTVRGQAPSLSIVQMNFPDTAYEGISYDSSSISVSVKNLSNNTTFVGSIYILIQQDSLGAVIDTLLVDSNQTTIQAGSFITLYPVSYLFTQNVYRTGGNTVVVWPVGLNANTADSLSLDFFFVKSNGIIENPDENNALWLVTDPAFHHLDLCSHKLPDEVRIFNLEAKLVYENTRGSSRINIEALKPGIYIIECRYRNQKSLFKKFTKL